MKVLATALAEIRIIEPRVFSDSRGFLFESHSRRVLAAAGIDAEFVQENHSRSAQHVLRGLHYQVRQPQGKLVRVVSGEVLDVSVDIRRGSPTFGKHVTCVLSADNRRIVWIPPGFAHGFVVRSPHAEFVYKTTDYYAPEHERSILWSDPALGIDWGLAAEPLLSDRDRMAPLLMEAEVYP